MNGIFISHSTKNKELVERIVALLQLGMGVESSKIFCTSLNGTLPTGKNFVEIIKENVRKQEMVMAVITPEYLKSQFCMMELGAAWIEAEYLCPILADGVDFKDLENSPLSGIQMKKIDEKDDWYVIYDELISQQIISTNTAQFNKQLQKFMDYIAACAKEDAALHSPDASGYYNVVIEKERNVPAPYKCYKIKGRLYIEKVKEQIESESHWIFYKEGVYDALRVGDKVRLKIGRTERKHYDDIGFARNIYPDEMYVEK